ncbi:hypothetical protein LMG19282_04232 [Cupriavidus campinensis]|nr:hypothetical protein LMG19282_04232 [Cupriavidus campinensis]
MVAISDYQSPSRFAVSVEPSFDMLQRNLAALSDGLAPPHYTVVGLFETEEAARDWGRHIQTMRNGRADIQDLLTRRPEED